ncbi:MAG: hypothetical protein RJR37_13325 [Peptococcaceae bacterium MAG4]|jgi:NAD-dependent SIR2 family protein deacetylase|nr:hypothetical protein [Peptococcaceae bacterium MAG4]NLW38574.1 hypothetical protein [Peptococcaceae bacterium]
MSGQSNKAKKQEWQCYKCKVPIKPSKARISYMGNEFSMELPRCPQCGLSLVPEELAIRKLLEIEQTLEDK